MWHEILSTFFDGISCFTGLLSCMTAFLVAVLAWYGYKNWLKDAKASAQVEVVRRLGTCAFSFADAFRGARSRVLHVEMPTETDTMTVEGRKRDAWEQTKRARSKLIEMLRQEAIALEQAQWEAMIVLGTDTEAYVKPLLKRYSMLRADFGEYCDHMDGEFRYDPDKEREASIVALRGRLFGTVDDEVSQELHQEANALMEKLREYMK